MMFIDSHKGNLDAQAIEGYRGVIKAGKADEFGVKPLNLYYNNEEGRLFCLTEAPTSDAVLKSHKKMGVTCDQVLSVKTIV